MDYMDKLQTEEMEVSSTEESELESDTESNRWVKVDYVCGRSLTHLVSVPQMWQILNSSDICTTDVADPELS